MIVSMRGNLKGVRFTIYFIILAFFFFFLAPELSFAQQLPLTPQEDPGLIMGSQSSKKEAAIRASMEEAAIRGSMEEAQMKLLKSSLKKKKEERQKKEKKEKKEKTKSEIIKSLLSRVHTYATVITTANDNVNATKENKKSSIINLLTPGLRMNLGGRGKSLALDMHIDNQFYNNRRRSNSQNAYFDILTAFSIKRYTLTFSENYFTNYFASEKLGVDDDDFVNYCKNTVNATLGRHFNRIGFDMGYKHINTEYELISKDSDSVQDAISFNQYLRLGSKTRLSFAYAYDFTEYIHKPNPDFNRSNNFALNLAGILSYKLTALAGIDYKLTDKKIGDDSRETTLSGTLGHKVSQRSDLALSLSHSIEESASKSNYYIENVFTFSVNHRLAFNPKLKVSFSSGATYGSYPKRGDFTREEELYALGLGLSYAFRHGIDLSLDWAHTKSESNINDDYYGNIFRFKTQAKF